MVQPLVAICLVGGLLSFLLVYIEVLLCHLTSSMTLTVLGIMKTILQIFLGFVVFGDRLGIRNISGLALVLIGVLWCVVFVKRGEFKIYSRNTIQVQIDTSKSCILITKRGDARNRSRARKSKQEICWRQCVFYRDRK